jgi:gliding motility-associated-like protein
MFGCKGDNGGVIKLTGNVGKIVRWEYSDDDRATWTVTSNTADSLVYNDLEVTRNYRVWVVSGTCAGAYSSVATVIIYPQPEATIIGSDIVCPNEEATFLLSVTNVPTGQGWTITYVENGTTKTISGTGSGQFTLLSGKYPYTTTPSTITISLASIRNVVTNCINTDLNSIATAIITPNPVAIFTANNACQDSAVMFDNMSTIAEGTITAYKWYFGDGDSSIAVSPSHAYKAAGIYTVRLIAYSANGCKGEVTKTVEIFDVPNADYTFNNICQNATFAPRDASTVAKGTITNWMWDFGDNSTSSVQNPTHTYASSGNFPVMLTVTTGKGCSNSITKELSVWTLPDANFVAAPVCEDQAMSFINSSAIAYGTMTYSWNFANQGTSIATNPQFTFTGNGNFNVDLKVTSDKGCTDSITNTVTVWPNPVSGFTVADVCIGETSEFVNSSSVSSGSITEYYWMFGDSSYSTGVNPRNTYARSNEAGYVVSLRSVTDKGCSDTVVGRAIVWPLPVVGITADQTEFCDGDSAILNATANQTVTSYFWSTEERTQSITAKLEGWYKVTVVGDPARGGCTNSDSIFITVWPNPMAYAGEDTTIHKGESTQLNGSGGVFYSWTPTTYLDNPSSDKPNAIDMRATTQYILVVTDDNGCIDSDTVLITVIDDFKLTVYNTVTPNGDGRNDTWIIDNIWAYPEAEVTIFNRYGMEVYRTTGYQNDWDGTNTNGDYLPDGAYYYVISVPGADKSYTGNINLLRSN